MRIFLRLIGILVVLIWVAGVGIYWYFSPARLKAYVAPYLADSLNRNVDLADVRWDGYGTRIGLSSLNIQDRPGFGDIPFLKADRVQMKISPWSVLFDGGSLGELRLEDATVSVVVDTKGNVNFADMAQKRSLRLPIDQVRWVNSTVHYDNWKTGYQTTLTLQEGRLYGRPGVMRIMPVKGQIFGGMFEGQATLRTQDAGGKADGSVSLTQVQAEQLMPGLGWQIPLYGLANLAVRFEGNLKPGLVWQKSSVQYEGTLRMAEGKIVKWKLLQDRLRGIQQLELLTADDVPVRDVNVAFRVVDGRMVLDGTRLTVADLACQINGWGNPQGELDYTVDVDVPTSHLDMGGFDLGRALGALLGRDAKIPIRVSIRGTAKRPQVTTSLR